MSDEKQWQEASLNFTDATRTLIQRQPYQVNGPGERASYEDMAFLVCDVLQAAGNLSRGLLAVLRVAVDYEGYEMAKSVGREDCDPIEEKFWEAFADLDRALKGRKS